jgi:hypothetical protein
MFILAGIVVSLLIPTLAAAQPTSDSTPLLISVLPSNLNKELAGCSCSFEQTSRPQDHNASVIAWALPEEVAYLTINGITERIPLSASRYKRLKGASGIGDTVVWSFKSRGIIATVSCKQLTRDCQAKSECEGAAYAGTLVVLMSSASKRIPIEGACGC